MLSYKQKSLNYMDEKHNETNICRNVHFFQLIHFLYIN